MPTAKHPVPKYLLAAVSEAHAKAEAAKVAMETAVDIALRGALDGVEPVPNSQLRLNLHEGVVEVVTPDPVEQKPDGAPE